MQTKTVSIDLGARSYDVHIGSGLLGRLEALSPVDLNGVRCFIVCDSNTNAYAQTVQDALQQTCGVDSSYIYEVPAGEASKSFSMLEGLCAWALEHRITRDSIIFAVGGGVVGDLAGFFASMVMRGVPYIQIPTTLLSQVDSSVGGKTAINTPQGKNLIGAFYQPIAVIADLDTLKTLAPREIKAGYAEILKYALINDAPFFNWLQSNGADVCAGDVAAQTYAIEKSVQAKTAIVQADEHEAGQRMLLNLGHSFAHALERAGGFDGTILHGEAVAIGMVMALDMSVRKKLCPLSALEHAEAHISDIGLPTRVAYMDNILNTSVEQLFDFMQLDKKVIGGTLNLILVNDVGEAFVHPAQAQDVDIIKDVLRQSLGGDVSGDGPQDSEVPNSTMKNKKEDMLKQWNST